MLKVSNIKVPVAAGKTAVLPAIASSLQISKEDIISFDILKSSIDSRKKSDVRFVYTIAVNVKNEELILSKSNDPNITEYIPQPEYVFPYKSARTDLPPIIVGMGPAGLFAALSLAEAGIPPIIIEQGKPVESRIADVESFWKAGKLSTSSNVQFGEGGAGTFSDGKLTTGINDPRIPYIFKQFVRFGAPEEIRYLSKPHIGTDKLSEVIKNLRLRLIKLGCDIRFENKLERLVIENGRLKSIIVSKNGSEYEINTDHLVLALGNSARDTFKMLKNSGVKLEAKNFAVGVRIEHLQNKIDMAQYGQAATLGTLPASDYKLAVHLASGRSVFTFCVCPGGQVVASSSEKGMVVTNGMSKYARVGKNINGGLLVGISPDDFGEDCLDGIEFQRNLEKMAFISGGENYHAPAQLVKDFLAKRPSRRSESVSPTYLPGVRYCNLWEVLPEFICQAIFEALPLMDRKINGFAASDAVLTAVETRSSSPVRIIRDDSYSASVKGIYPCGEGAGFAGGIMSAAADGIKCAEAICSKL